MTDDFAYLNARIRVRRSRLLPEGFFREALGLGFPDLLKRLQEGIYGPDLTGDTLPDLDRAVRVHLGRTVGDLPGLVSGQAREAASLLLMRADLANLKTILRGQQAGWTKGEILSHLGAGTIPRALYGLMAEAADPASLAQLLALSGHPLAGALREAVSGSPEPVEMEINLDRGFYPALLRRAQELNQPYLVDFMRFEIDALNLATAFKLSSLGFPGPAQRFFIPAGRRVALRLFELLAQGEAAALAELGNTALAPVAEAQDLSALERGLRCLLLARARQGLQDILGPGLANEYILRKEWEAGRVRLLARRSFFELPPAAIEQELFCQ
ncbi:MAG: V-type ATPase subunit [Desulfobaccales bacterium]